jgi:hypothetical protein
MTGVRSPAEAMNFSSSLSRPDVRSTEPPIKWAPGVLSPGSERDANHSPHLVPRSRCRSYISSHPYSLHGVAGQLYLLYSSLHKGTNIF